MQLEFNAEGPEQRSNNHLGIGIPLPNLPHNVAALRLRKYVQASLTRPYLLAGWDRIRIPRQ